QGRSHDPIRGSAAADQAVSRAAEEAGTGRGVYRGVEEKVADRGPDLNEQVLPAAAAALERGEPAALVTIVRSTGSTPQRTGAKMLVSADGRSEGPNSGEGYETVGTGTPKAALV